LPRTRSPISSRSNCAKDELAKDNRKLRVKRAIEVVVANCWVTETKDVPPGIEDFDDLGKIGERAG
jgi:hypothetical protein